MRNLEENVVLCIELIVLTRWQGAEKRKKKKSSHGYFLMNKIIGFENGSKQSDPPKKNKKDAEGSGRRRNLSRFTHIWWPYLVNCGRINCHITKKKNIFPFSARRPQAPAETDAGWPLRHWAAGLWWPLHVQEHCRTQTLLIALRPANALLIIN